MAGPKRALATMPGIDPVPDDEDGRWNERQRRFVANYLLHNNGARALREAGYAMLKVEDQANYAYRLLRMPHIKRFVERERKRISDELAISPQRVLEEMAKLAFSNLADLMRIGPDGLPYWDLTHATREQLAGVKGIKIEETNEPNEAFSEIEYEAEKAAAAAEDRDPEYDVPRTITVRKVTLTQGDKLGALTQLGRNLKLWTDRTEVSMEFGDGSTLTEARLRLRAERLEREAAMIDVTPKDGTDG